MQFHDLIVASAALAGVLGLIWLIQRGVRAGGLAQFQPTGRGVHRLRLVQSLAIDPRRRVLLLACDDREVLVLTGGNTDLLLGWTGAPEREQS